MAGVAFVKWLKAGSYGIDIWGGIENARKRLMGRIAEREVLAGPICRIRNAPPKVLGRCEPHDGSGRSRSRPF